MRNAELAPGDVHNPSVVRLCHPFVGYDQAPAQVGDDDGPARVRGSGGGDGGGSSGGGSDCAFLRRADHGGPAEEVFLKSVAAAQFGLDVVKVKEHSCRLAFAMTDFKLQGRALSKLILSICKRPTPPWMELAGFYVLISRVRTMEGLRVLYRDEQGLAHLRTLQWKPQLGAWVQGYDDQGRWSDKRAAAAYKTVCAAQAILRDRKRAEA